MKRDSTVLSDFLILRSFLKEKYLTIIQRKDITHNSQKRYKICLSMNNAYTYTRNSDLSQ